MYASADESWERRAGLDAGLDTVADVAVSSDVATVYGLSGDVGIFEERDGSWERATVLATPGNGPQDYSIVMDGRRALVGRVGGTGDGSPVSVVEPAGGSWEITTTLTPDSGSVDGQFGSALALSGERALVAREAAEVSTGGTGAVYLFERSDGEWTQRGRITGPLRGHRRCVRGATRTRRRPSARHPVPRRRRHAGVRVRTDGRCVRDAGGTPAGSGSGFGDTLALVGSTALVGDPSATNADADVYVHKRDDGSWSETARFTESPGDGFADTLAMSADTAIVGQPHSDEAGDNAGAAAIFR